MKKMLVALLAVGAAISAMNPAVAEATTWKWKDESGRWVFGSIPPTDAKGLSQVNARANSIAQDGFDPNQDAKKFAPLKLFVSDSCGDGCEQAKKFLNGKGLSYSTVRAEANQEEFKKKVPNGIVPALFVGEKLLSGFEAGGWDAAIVAAGYKAQQPKKETNDSR